MWRFSVPKDVPDKTQGSLQIASIQWNAKGKPDAVRCSADPESCPILSGRLPVTGRTVAAALTGANVDPTMYQRALAAGG